LKVLAHNTKSIVCMYIELTRLLLLSTAPHHPIPPVATPVKAREEGEDPTEARQEGTCHTRRGEG
jgi:hypothetical protein